tara:strand:+ start:159823 stop:162828 length:3006 start_codon:yes stop_codon:yes gene_type:complete
MSKPILFCFTIFFLVNTFGQNPEIVSEKYFSDTTNGFIDNVFDFIKVENGIILSASVDSVYDDHPCIIKVDLNGDIVWSTNNTDKMTANATRTFEIILSNDGYVYGISLDHPENEQNNYLWKVDAQTGELVWRKLYLDTQFSWEVEILDYDSSQFLLGYLRDEYGGDYPKIVKVDKLIGDTIETKIFPEDSEHCNIITDESKNIYLAQNEYLHKFNRDNINIRLWRRRFNTGLPEDERLDCIKDIHKGKNNGIYLFGSEGNCYSSGNGIVIKINEHTGDTIWKTIGCYGNVRVSDVAENDSILFISYKKGTTSQGSFLCAKINKYTGLRSWLTIESMTPIGVPQNYSGGVESALSIDLDCSGDIYSTGFYGDPNFGPGAWGIMKIDGNTGEKIYDLTITEDSTIYDQNSTGIISFVYGNTPVIIGNQDRYTGGWPIDDSYPVFTKLNQMGDVLLKRRIGGFYPFESEVRDIKNYQHEVITLSQLGASIQIQKLDTLLQEQWTMRIDRPGIIYADQMKIDSSYIYITGHAKDSLNTPPYHENETSSIHFFKFSLSTGDLIDNDSIDFNQNHVKPIEIELLDSNLVVFFIHNDSIKYVKWSGNSISNIEYFDEINDNANFTGNLNIVSKKNEDTLIAVGSENIFYVDKNSMIKSSFLSFPYSTYYDHLIENDKIYMSGKGPSGNQTISSYNLITGLLNYEYTSTENGEFVRIDMDSLNHLITAGSGNNKLNVACINKVNGQIEWINYLDTVSYANMTVQDLVVNNENSYVAVSGYSSNNNSSDAIIFFNELNNNLSDSIIKIDQIDNLSRSNPIELLNDGSILVGGAHNTTLAPLSGFISQIEYNACYYLDADIQNNNYILVAEEGMDSYQWFDCDSGVDLTYGNTETFLPTYNGDYGVEISQGMCRALSYCITLNDLSIEEINSNKIMIYPNPTNGKISISSSPELNQVDLYSITGEKLSFNNISFQNSQNIEIDISNQDKGLYFIHLYTKEGLFIKRVIKI